MKKSTGVVLKLSWGFLAKIGKSHLFGGTKDSRRFIKRKILEFMDSAPVTPFSFLVCFAISILLLYDSSCGRLYFIHTSADGVPRRVPCREGECAYAKGIFGAFPKSVRIKKCTILFLFFAPNLYSNKRSGRLRHNLSLIR